MWKGVKTMENLITIKDLYEHYKTLTSNGAFLGTSTSLDRFSFMSDYQTNHSAIDLMMCTKKYPDLVFGDDKSITNAYNNFRTLVIATLILNKYKYETLYETLSFEYNPINNYDMSESGTDTKGARTDTNGAYTDTTTNDACNDTITNGAYTDSTTTNAYSDVTTNASAQDKVTNGAQSRTTNDGAQVVNTVVTNDVTGYNLTPSDTHPKASALDNSSTTNTNNGAKISTENIESYDVTNDYGQRSTTFNGGERVTNLSAGERQQTNAYSERATHESHAERTMTEGEQINSYTHERHGNIGVMSTQDLIGQQRQIANFKFYEILFDDIMRATCIPIYK